MKRILTCFALVFSLHTGAQTISTIAGTGVAGLSGDNGPATAAKTNLPTSVISDAAGNIYFTDLNNNCVRKINASGIITTIAGSPSGASGFSGDGGPATAALLNKPQDVAFDDTGNLYIADGSNQRVRKINTSGIISTIAGNGAGTYSGDGGAATAASFWEPIYVCTDHFGNVYVSDNQNQRVRKITPAGIVTTVLGNGTSGDTGDGGPATAAEISYPGGIKVDAAKNLYVSLYSNNIRKVDSNGIVTTIIGNGTAGFAGDGGPGAVAELHEPIGLIIDPLGDFIFADVQNNRIRKVSAATGIITTIAGNGTPGYAGDGMAATAAELNIPNGICLDPAQNLIISDGNNNRIRKVSYNNHPTRFTGGHSQSMSVCNTASSVNIDTLLAISDSDAGQTETWTVILGPAHGTLVAAYSTTSTGGIIIPTGLSYTPVTGYAGPDSFRVRIADAFTTDTTTIHVTVLAGPSIASIIGPDTICAPAQLVTIYTDSTPGGTWSMTNGLATISPTGTVTGLTVGRDTVKYSETGVCGSGFVIKPIYVGSVPVDSLITGPSALCIGTTITLADATPGGVWAHTTGNTMLAPGGVVVGLAPGGYDTITYSVTNYCGIGLTAHLVQVYTPWQCDSALATVIVDRAPDGIRLSPNPATSTLRIDWPASAVTTIQLYNAIGQVVVEAVVTGTSAELDIRHLTPGTYLVRVAQDGQMLHSRFVRY